MLSILVSEFKQGSAGTGHDKEGTQTYAQKAKGTAQQVGQKSQETPHTATEKTRTAGQQASEKVVEGVQYGKECAESAAERTRAGAQQTGQTVIATAASATILVSRAL